MTDPTPNVETRGFPAAARDLRALGVRSKDVRGISYKARTIFRKSEEARFAYEGYGAWPQLAPSTKEKKARAGQDPRLMRATGLLYRSLTAPTAALQIDERKPDEFRFGTRVPYARFHEQGKGVPKRELISLRPSEQQAMTKAIQAFIASGETSTW